MPSVINTNITSLNTQRNLSASQSSLNTSIQRLSSGMRVNSAKDDAAGLSISNRMTASITGGVVGQRNANDAISYAQTAEGALGKVSDALQRMRELAVQSANATNTGADRSNLNDEFTELQKEVDRLTTSTKFNGQAVLAATEDKEFQVGATTGSSDRITIKKKDLTDAANDVAIATKGKFSLNAAGDQAENDAAVARFTAAGGSVTATAIDPATGKAVLGTVTAGTATAEDLAIVNANVRANGAAMEAAYKVDPNVTETQASSGAGRSTFSAGTAEATAAYDASIKNEGTALNARAAIDQIDKALTEVAGTRANFGAVQNRFESVISNLQVSVENQTNARSRITDADYASETANLSRNQILQQAGTAMLAQANSLPNGVLSLLRG